MTEQRENIDHHEKGMTANSFKINKDTRPIDAYNEGRNKGRKEAIEEYKQKVRDTWIRFKDECCFSAQEHPHEIDRFEEELGL